MRIPAHQGSQTSGISRKSGILRSKFSSNQPYFYQIFPKFLKISPIFTVLWLIPGFSLKSAGSPGCDYFQLILQNWGFEKDMFDPYYKQSLENIDENYLRFVIFFFLFTALLIKYQIISVIYRCYKHITTQVV